MLLQRAYCLLNVAGEGLKLLGICKVLPYRLQDCQLINQRRQVGGQGHPCACSAQPLRYLLIGPRCGPRQLLLQLPPLLLQADQVRLQLL